MDGRSNVWPSNIRPTDGLQGIVFAFQIAIDTCSLSVSSINHFFRRTFVRPTGSKLNQISKLVRHSTIWASSISAHFKVGRTNVRHWIFVRPTDPNLKQDMLIQLFDIRQSERRFYIRSFIMFVHPTAPKQFSISPPRLRGNSSGWKS